MQKEITDKQKWYEIDGPQGREFVPADLVGTEDEELNRFIEGEMKGPVPEALAQYCENTEAWTIERTEGYGARMSAPGYLDCTDWSVFDTPEKAEKHLDEMYGDDADEDLEPCAVDECNNLGTIDPEDGRGKVCEGHVGEASLG